VRRAGEPNFFSLTVMPIERRFVTPPTSTASPLRPKCCADYRGPLDPLHGDTFNAGVRSAAKVGPLPPAFLPPFPCLGSFLLTPAPISGTMQSLLDTLFALQDNLSARRAPEAGSGAVARDSISSSSMSHSKPVGGGPSAATSMSSAPATNKKYWGVGNPEFSQGASALEMTTGPSALQVAVAKALTCFSHPKCTSNHDLHHLPDRPDRPTEPSKGDGTGNFMNKVKTQINRLADRLPDFLDDKDQPVRSLGPSDSHR
jgi:hypothetical protein